MPSNSGYFMLFSTLLLALSLSAQENDADRRAEAHRTIMRRFSAKGAKTRELGLSQAATGFIDIYCDLERNRSAIRKQQAPQSRIFRGVPHQVLRMEGDQVYLAAAFVQLVIDEQRVPLAEMPGLLAAVAGPDFPKKVRVSQDTPQVLAEVRINLLHNTYNTIYRSCLRDKKLALELAQVEKKLCALALDSLDKVGPRTLMAPLDLLKRTGGSAAAKALIKMYRQPPANAPRYIKGSLVRAICNMKCPEAETFFLKIMQGKDRREKSLALGSLTRIHGEKTAKVLAGLFQPGANQQLQSAAIRALTACNSREALEILKKARPQVDARLQSKVDLALAKQGDDQAQARLKKAFAAMADSRQKYFLSLELARAGLPIPVPYLRKKLQELKQSKDRFAANQIGAVERALAGATAKDRGQ